MNKETHKASIDDFVRLHSAAVQEHGLAASRFTFVRSSAEKSTDRKSENKNTQYVAIYILADFYYLNCKILMPCIQEPRILSTNYLSNEVTRVHIYIQQCPNILLRLDSDALASCFSWSMASRLTR